MTITHSYQFVAGNLALDFVNTMAFRADPDKRNDLLQRAEDVQRWAIQAELPEWVDTASVPGIGAASLNHIRQVREQLHSVFHAIATDDLIPPENLVRIGNAFHDCCARRRLSNDAAEIRWTWRASARRSDYLLYPILTSATELLTSDSRGLVRQCGDAHCGWLFLDRSNARKRRWCSMADCGNRNKARNHYRRETG